MATIHANDTSSMLDRICQLIDEVVYPAPRLLVAQTVNVCVHIRWDKRHPAGRSLSGLDRVLGIDMMADGSSIAWQPNREQSANRPLMTHWRTPNPPA